MPTPPAPACTSTVSPGCWPGLGVGHVLVPEDLRAASLVVDGRLHGFTARTNALMTLPATCGASRSAAAPWEARNS